MKTQHFVKALCAGLAAVVLASPDAAAGLTIEMTNTITVTTTSAVLRARVVTNDEATAQGWIYWGLTNNGNNATWPNTNSLGTVITGSVYTVSLSGLTAGTTYWATAYATNGATNAWATWQTNFSTLATYSPTSILVSTYPSGVLRAPANFFGANGIPTSNNLASATNALDIALRAIIALGDTAGTNYANTVTNALDIALRAIIAAGDTSSTNYADAATNALDIALRAIIALGDTASTNYANAATNALDIALRAVIALGDTASTNYANAATNALDIALRAIIALGDTASTNYANAATNALRIWAESRAVASTQTIAGASVVGAVPSATTAAQATGIVGVVTGNILTNTPTLQQVINAGNGATNVGSLADITDMSGSGRAVFGTGLNLTDITATSVGASQHGVNDGGTQTIGNNSYGASQRGYNFGGTQTIANASYGSSQHGVNWGSIRIISQGTYGASQHGYNEYAQQTIGETAHGASQRGYAGAGSTATNDGVGAMQLYELTAGQNALTTTEGDSSLLLGAGTSSNRNAIVAGDGAESHGDGSITAQGGLWSMSGGNVVTNGASPTFGTLGFSTVDANGTNAIQAAQSPSSLPAGTLMSTGGTLSAGFVFKYSEGNVSGVVTGYFDAGGAGDFLADGSAPMTGPLNFGGQKGTNLADGTIASDAAALGQVWSGDLAGSNGIASLEAGVLGLTNRAISLEAGVLDLTNRTVSLESGVLGLTNRAVSLEAGVLGLTNRAVSLEAGVLDLTNRTVSLESGILGLTNRAVSLETGVLDLTNSVLSLGTSALWASNAINNVTNELGGGWYSTGANVTSLMFVAKSSMTVTQLFAWANYPGACTVTVFTSTYGGDFATGYTVASNIVLTTTGRYVNCSAALPALGGLWYTSGAGGTTATNVTLQVEAVQ